MFDVYDTNKTRHAEQKILFHCHVVQSPQVIAVGLVLTMQCQLLVLSKMLEKKNGNHFSSNDSDTQS